MALSLKIKNGVFAMIERMERVVCDICSATSPEVRDGKSSRQAAEAEG